MKLIPTSLVALALTAGLATGALADTRSTYIVQLAAEPAASYSGNIAGFAATRPAPGSRFNARSQAVQAYKGFLDSQQTSVKALVSTAPIVARYSTVFNGFAAKLTATEVAALQASPLVISVQRDERRKLDTITTPAFLSLSTPGGVWSQTVGGYALKGEDIVIGMIDGGVWPESPAYADRVAAGKPVFSGGTQVYGPPPATWLGTCVAGEGFVPATHCNNKLIGAQFFNAGFLAQGLTKNWSEFYSPRDSVGGNLAHGGHGSHTSSTAGGNSNVTAIVSGINMGSASGIAPRARIAMYKVCWSYDDAAATDGTGSSNSCWNSDSVLAIDKAVADGVNVINFSISGSQTSVNDPVEQAFLRANNAGVFVAASAGNSGPANQVAHIGPWLTTVAASTHDRDLKADVTLGNAVKYSGASLNTAALPAAALIRAEDAGLPGADATNLSLCYSSPAVLDPAKVSGKVVICTRGVNARVDKSFAVLQAGGVGMIMKDNNSGLVAEAHSVPTVHVTSADGTAIQNYAVAAGAGATAAISTFYAGIKPAPIMASFSSRGPNQGDGNVLKPDLTAPGVDVIATVSSALTAAQHDQVVAGTLVPPPEWASYQGTSMSSPHVAGLAALIKQAHPTWSPAAIKSALMTTASTTLTDGLTGMQNGLLPWSQGAGHVSPLKALDPGLVYDAGKNDWIKYQCKVNRAAVSPASDCTTIGTLDETYNLNLPSITVSTVVVNATVTRSVTNVGTGAATYTALASVPGFTPLVTPTSLTLLPGETKSFTLKLTTTTAVQNAWNYGSLTWTDGTHVVKIPVTARAGQPITAPAQIDGTSSSGTRLITVLTGFAGRMTSVKGGLKDVTLSAQAALRPSTYSSITTLINRCKTPGLSTKAYDFAVPAGTIVARFATRDEDVGVLGDDNDMIVLSPGYTSYWYSGNDGSNESVQIANPAEGTYRVCVQAYASGSTPPSTSITHKLSSWIVGPSDTGGNFNVLLPGQVYAGGTSTVGLAWSGLPAGHRYIGGFQLKDASGTVQTTTAVRVETNGGLPLTDSPRAVTTKQLRN